MQQREIVGLPTTVYPVDEWALVERDFEQDYLGRTETIFAVSNGYVGIRGAPDEGRPATDAATYVNGLHETWPIQHAEEAFGFAETGQTMIPVPDVRRFHLYVDDEPLFLPTADLEEYERRLDLRDGVLRRELVWRTPSGKRVRVSSQRLVSMHHRHLVSIRYEVELLDGTAPIIVSSQLRKERGQEVADADDPRRTRHLGDVLAHEGARIDGERAVQRYRVRRSGMTLAVGIDHSISVEVGGDGDPPEIEVHSVADDERAKTVVRLDGAPGTVLRIDKHAAYFTSRSVETSRLADRAERALDRALRLGHDELLRLQRAWYASFWERADVVVAGNPVVQQAVRWNLFQLIQASARAEGTLVPAKGLTGSGYEGHYFWDIEIYVLPFLIWTHPEVARSLLRFRSTLLDDARRRAREVNQKGALFPWRTINGEEASAYYEAGTAQYHINADIAYALCRYVDVTGDQGFLRRFGAEMLVETARLWADLGFFRDGGEDSFHIYGVTGPDEYTTLVNDNAYTNLMARRHLRRAAETVDQLREHDRDAWLRLVQDTAVTDAEVARWRQAAAIMHVPHDDRLGITPQDENFLQKERWPFDDVPRDRYPLLLHYHPLVIYRFQVIKQADVALAMVLLPEEFDHETTQRNFDYYDPLTTGDSSLSAGIQAIVAARLGESRRANELFRYGLFVDLADVAGNASDGVHIAAAGGVWMTLVHGFVGMTEHRGRHRFDPHLPGDWQGLSCKVTIRGSRMRVDVDRFEVAYVHEHGDEPIRFDHRDEEVVLEPGEKVVRSLAGHEH